jgi:hypothetical protein
MLKAHGAFPNHRSSYARVREAFGLDPIQSELFAVEEDYQDSELKNHLNVNLNMDGFVNRVQEKAEV